MKILITALLSLWVLLLSGGAFAQLSVGVVTSNSSLSVYQRSFGGGIQEFVHNKKVAIQFKGADGIKEKFSTINSMIEHDKTIKLIVVDMPAQLTKDISRIHNDVGFFVTQNLKEEDIPLLIHARNVISYSPMPRQQYEFLKTVTMLTAHQADAVILNDTYDESTARNFVNDLGRSSPDIKLVKLNLDGAEPSEEALGSIVSTNPKILAAILPEHLSEGLWEKLVATKRYGGSVLAFSPPPVQTRAHLAGRLIGLQLSGTVTTDGLRIIEGLRKIPRYSSETNSIELAWSVRFTNLIPAVVQRQQPQFYGPDKSGTDNNQECSCKNASGKLVSCKQCAPGKCSIKDDNSDYCSTECKDG